ncbi:putative disease resistance protein RGA3 [Coffea arabica]|uniref:Disease resistance protein RGA3 n=1 Tax=Coffea arabica TaxID=13443 RepID=A0A6P6W1E3_COFAR
MADAFLGATIQFLEGKAITLASQQISLSLAFKRDLPKLKKTPKIQAVFHDAEQKKVTLEYARLWLKELEDVAFDANNLLDDLNYEMILRKVEIQKQVKRKVYFSLSLFNPITFRFKMANRIRTVTMELKRINEEAKGFGLQSQNGEFMKNRETNYVTIDSSFVGRDDDLSMLVTGLTAASKNEIVLVLPIVGMGGIGKITLARKVFNDLKIENQILTREYGYMVSTGLDDVWNEQATPWNDFLGSLKGISSSKGNSILLTTRQQQGAAMTRISSPCSLKKLPDDECWLILKENAFGAGEVPDGLQDIGYEIAKKCHGVPSAANVLGRILRNKGSDERLSILETGLQNLGGDEKLSVHHLPSPLLKKCFANNMEMEEVGEMFFSILLETNLLQDAVKDEYRNVLNCKMHDLVHDLALSIFNYKALRLKGTRTYYDETLSIRYLATEKSDEEISFPLHESFRYITTLFLSESRLIT